MEKPLQPLPSCRGARGGHDLGNSVEQQNGQQETAEAQAPVSALAAKQQAALAQRAAEEAEA